MLGLHRTQFRKRRQQHGENLQQFSADFFRLARLAFSAIDDDVLETMAVDVFADGVRDTKLQQTLKLSKPNTLGETLAKALEYESVKRMKTGYVRATRISVTSENGRKT